MGHSHQPSLSPGTQSNNDKNNPITETNLPIISANSPSHPFQPRDATPSETSLYPHVTDKIPLSAWIVILAGAAERACYFGIIAPWQNYLQNPRSHDAVPGALGLGQSTATNISNAFFLFSFLTPMGFAVLADVWWGRFWTLVGGLV